MKPLLRKAIFRLPNVLFKPLISIYGTIFNRKLCTVSEINNTWLLRTKNEKFIFPDRTHIRVNAFKLSNKYEYFYRIKPDDIIVHIGAAIGLDVWYFCQLVDGTRGRIIAIEAYPDNCKILKENIRLNKWKQVKLIECGVWKHPGEMQMIKHKRFTQHSMHSFSDRAKMGSVKVKVDTLDNIIYLNNITKINLLHMNIEGAEIEALEGATNTLKITRYCIISTHTTEKGSTMPRVKSILEENGFKSRESEQIKTHLLGWKQ